MVSAAASMPGVLSSAAKKLDEMAPAKPLFYNIRNAQTIVDFAVRLHPELATLATSSQVLAALNIRKQGDAYIWIPR